MPDAKWVVNLYAQRNQVDLANVTVGRVLVDPAAEAELSEEERVVRAASLVALSAMHRDEAPRLRDLLPDPATRARFEAVEPIVRSLGPLVEQIAEELCERGRLDAEEIALAIEGDAEALRHHRLRRESSLLSPFLSADDEDRG